MAQQPGAQAVTDSASYPHASEPIGTVRQMYDGALTPEMAVNTFRNIDRLFPTRTVAHGAHPKPLPLADTPLRDVSFRDRRFELHARAISRSQSRRGHARLERRPHCARALSLRQHRAHALDVDVGREVDHVDAGRRRARAASHRVAADPVTKYVTSLAGSAYDGVSVRDILMMSSGVRWNETYTDSSSDRRHLLEAQIAQRPGAAMHAHGHAAARREARFRQ